MKFKQLDQVIELIPGKSLSATRKLHANEDYLRDHFPLFPVMPGVLMLEALFQASCYLIRASENFECSILSLKEAKNVKFADFIEPGDELRITVEIVKSDDQQVSLKGVGMKGDATAVSARLVVAKSRLSDRDPELENLDRFIASEPKAALEKLMKSAEQVH